MANLVRLQGNAAELPYLSLSYPVDPAESSLAEGLAAYQDLKLQIGLQSLPRERREEITAFLRRFGARLYRALFPGDQGRRLDPSQPILLQCDSTWSMYPWELLHDGRQWAALHGGLVRMHPGGERLGAENGVSTLLGISAQPLAAGARDPLAALYRVTGGRFVSALAEIVEPLNVETPGLTTRVLEHASGEEFKRALISGPDVLVWSGFADAEALFFESGRLETERLPFPAVQETLREAVRRGLKLVILNGSLGLIDPARSAAQAAGWLSTGLPWLIGIEGVQARVRQHDYLRALTRHLAQGFSVFESHLSALRRLQRRFEEGWDWSYARFHARQPPKLVERPEAVEARTTPARIASAERAADVRPNPASGGAGRAPRLAGEDPARPAPPAFRRRRRVFARHEELRTLAKAVLPERRADSPLIFLCGPAGSGKTVLALEIAKRLHRHFGTVLYLHGRDLLPVAGEGAPGSAPFLAQSTGVERLAAEIGIRLGLRPAAGGPVAGGAAAGGAARSWLVALRRHLGDGEPRLILLDGLESTAGFEPLLSALAEPGPDTRLLVLTRGRPPLLPGFRLELPPLDSESLAQVFDEAFLERLQSHAPRPGLLGPCQRDLLAARVLRRIDRWPEGAVLASLTVPEGGATAAGRDALLTWATVQALGEIGTAARGVAEALTLMTGLVHRDTVAQIAGAEARELSEALAELQWFGLVDVHDGERYASIPPRVQRVLGERAMTRTVFAKLLPRLALSAETYLGAVGTELARAPSGSLWEDAAAAFAWRGEPSRRNSADPRSVQRLAIERANLAETGLMLAEEGDARSLARLAEGAKPLGRLHWMMGVETLLGACLYGAAGAAGDRGLQAQALNRAGCGLMAEERHAEAAKALERALELLGQGSSWEALGETYLLLSRCYARLEHLDAAENLLASAVELAYQLGSGNQLVQALEASAELWRVRSAELERAEQHLPRAIRFLEERQQIHLAAQVRRLHADCHLRARRAGEAEKGYRGALHAFLRAGDRREAAQTGLRLAECLVAQERASAALECFDDARAALADEHAEDPAALARTLHAIAELLQRQGRADLSVRALMQVRDWREQCGDREGVMRVLDTLGGLYFQLGQQAESTRCYEERLILQAERSAAPA
jgi:tetratricopeptide (TPR) repeat protein